MAFVMKIQNGTGDGAGRARYLARKPDKVLAVSANIPSPALIFEDYKALADDFNRTLLARQGDYRTDHFVVSFQHRFSQEELEKITEIIETEFKKEFGEDRPYLIVVHAEEFKNKTPEEMLEEKLSSTSNSSTISGTSFHVVLGRNVERKGIRLGKAEYLAFKRRLAEKLQPFANEREREVFQHFLERKRERDYYRKGELYAPEKNEKVWAKKILKDVIQALEREDIEKVVGILNQHNAEIETFEISPYNKRKLKKPTTYILFPRLNGDEMFAMRLQKKAQVLFEKYKTVFEELKNESEGTIREISEVEKGIPELKRGIRNRIPELKRGITLNIQRSARPIHQKRGADGGADIFRKLEKEYARLAELRQELDRFEKITERHTREPEQDDVDRNRRNRSSDASPATNTVQSQVSKTKNKDILQDTEETQEDIKVVYMGIKDDEVIITTKKEALEEINAEEIEEIEYMEDILKYIQESECEYKMSGLPEWLIEEIEEELEGMNDCDYGRDL